MFCDALVASVNLVSSINIIFAMMLTVTTTTADYELVFSAMSLEKAYWRTRLDND